MADEKRTILEWEQATRKMVAGTIDPTKRVTKAQFDEMLSNPVYDEDKLTPPVDENDEQ